MVRAASLIGISIAALAGGALAQPEAIKHGLLDYGAHFSDASVTVGTKHFSVYVHAKDPSLLIQNKVSQAFSAVKWTQEDYRAAAEVFVRPVGCTITELHAVSKAWEATYACPAGVELRSLAKAQREALKAGEQLKLDASK